MASMIRANVRITRNDLTRAETAARKIDGTTEAIQLDITDESSLRHATELLRQRQGRLEVLANNSGVRLDGDSSLPRSNRKRCATLWKPISSARSA